MDDKEKFYAELDDLREYEIRERLGKGVWAADKEKLAQFYLEEKARARAKAAEPEAVGIARSAKTAAWVANAIAFFALIVALVALYSNWE
jgi:hypothetical protein